MRTTDEILARISDIRSRDLFGFEQSDLINALPFEQAKPFLKEGVTADQWAEAQEKDPLARAREYMAFAWNKANNCRGISATRSVSHFQSWLWLAGSDDFDDIAEAEYQFYGKPVLVVAAEALAVDWRALDDGFWTNCEGGTGISPSDDEIARLTELAKPIKAAIDGGPA